MAQQNQITYVGHATVLLEMDGMRILTDPVLRRQVFHLHRRGKAARRFNDQRIDAVLISHLHLDHFDVPSLKWIGKGSHIIVPHGAGELMHRKGFTNIEEMRPGEATRMGVLTIRATHAEHHSIYPPFGPVSDCLGYLIQGSKTIYFPGDTDLFPGMAHLADHLDVVLLPVWGWGPNLGPGHMNPERAAQSLPLLRPRIAIPIHWGTFYPSLLTWFRPYLMVEPPKIFQEYASRVMPQVDVRILNPGSSLLLT
jgi:L-ascorbate metabolism protein UlaG (beta-lactamase superfamily)